MNRTFRAATVAAVLLAGSAVSAVAAESTLEMKALREKGIGPVIGTIQVVEEADGLVLNIDLNELPPGKNRLFMHDAGDCNLPRSDLRTNALAVVDVDITESGAEPLKTTLHLPGAKLDDMANKALLIRRGSDAADAAPDQTAQPRMVACGVVK